MKRRKFLKGLIALPALFAGLASVAKARPKQYVVGGNRASMSDAGSPPRGYWRADWQQRGRDFEARSIDPNVIVKIPVEK